MKYDNEPLLVAQSREELRSWLITNSTVERACWVSVSITPQPRTLLYLDAVEEALCFGWIDGIKKKLHDGVLSQRLSPRAPGSSWTELNKERVRRLQRLGLMRDEGRRVLPDLGEASFQIDPGIEQALREDREVYENFMAFPALYRRVRIDTIQSAKKQLEVFRSRLEKLIACTKANKLYGQWNDGGRLLPALEPWERFC